MGSALKSIGDFTLDIVSGGTMGNGIVGGITGQTAARTAADAEKRAAADAAAQKADIAKQEKLIADEQKRQDKVAAERAGRLSQNLLLSGSETGVTTASLLKTS